MTDTPTLTRRAKEFVKANDISRVIAGAAIGNGGKGGRYTLANGRKFQLDLADLKSLPDGYPKWMHHG